MIEVFPKLTSDWSRIHSIGCEMFSVACGFSFSGAAGVSIFVFGFAVMIDF